MLQYRLVLELTVSCPEEQSETDAPRPIDIHHPWVQRIIARVRREEAEREEAERLGTASA